MKPTRFALTAVTALAVAAGSTTITTPAQASTRPGVVIDYGYTTPVVKVRPKTIWPYKDVHYTKMRWSKLTSTKGYATGTQHINTCEPSCADANYISTKVTMTFTRVRKTSTHRKVFTRVRVTEIKTRKAWTLDLPLG